MNTSALRIDLTLVTHLPSGTADSIRRLEMKVLVQDRPHKSDGWSVESQRNYDGLETQTLARLLFTNFDQQPLECCELAIFSIVSTQYLIATVESWLMQECAQDYFLLSFHTKPSTMRQKNPISVEGDKGYEAPGSKWLPSA